jgi:hypothetical protein
MQYQSVKKVERNVDPIVEEKINRAAERIKMLLIEHYTKRNIDSDCRIIVFGLKSGKIKIERKKEEYL